MCVFGCACVHLLSYFRIFREPKIIFAIVSVVVVRDAFFAGVGFSVAHALSRNSNIRLHIILNPMFTQFTVHISSVQNPKTNTKIRCVFVHPSFLWHSSSGRVRERARERFWVLCTHHNPEWIETKRNALSSAYKFYSNAHTTHHHFKPVCSLTSLCRFHWHTALARFAHSIEFECVRWKFIYII